MRCDDMHELISPYIDGELGLVKTTEIERHLQDCAVCMREYKNYSALRTGLRGAGLYFKAPEGLENRLRSAVRSVAEGEGGTGWFRGWFRGWRLFAVAAAAAVILLVAGVVGIRWSSTRAENDRLAQAVVANHIRSLMANHLTDVVSTDQHTVKPWFNGKLDFSPPVKDLESAGFPLVGGRLDYLANRPVAALVYQRRQHFINLFIWPSDQGDAGEVEETPRQGYNVIHWNYQGSACWAVSDLNVAELQQFVTAIQ